MDNPVIDSSIIVAILGLALNACKGPAGPIGHEGQQGIQGEKGNTGEQGKQGEKGDKGDQGIKGEQGIQGEKGDKGDQGAAGVSIIWKGESDTPLPDSEENWAYYNSADKTSYIFDGTDWQILTKDGAQGTDGVSIIWRGESDTPLHGRPGSGGTTGR